MNCGSLILDIVVCVVILVGCDVMMVGECGEKTRQRVREEARTCAWMMENSVIAEACPSCWLRLFATSRLAKLFLINLLVQVVMA